jgi:outer membrane protein insertion porin family
VVPLTTAPVVQPSLIPGPTASTTPNPAPPVTSPSTAGSRVADIRISGNNNISRQAITAILRQKPGTPFNPADVEADRQAIYAMGYFTVVTVKVEPGENSGDVRETFSVVENPKIGKVVFTGNTAFLSDKLLAVMSTKSGEVLNTNKLDQDIQSIINLYKDKGYRASISEDINIDPNTQVLSIPIIEARITAVQITGNKKTKTYIITREMKQKPGALYNQNVFSEDLKRIFNTNLFENVGPADISTPNVGSVVLAVPVLERRTGNVSVGVGYSSREKLVGRAELSESNFRGMGETVAIMWEVGGSQSTSSTDVSFSDPWIDKHHTGFSINIYDKVIYRFTNSFLSGATSGSNDQYLERRKGALVSLSRPIDDHSTLALSGRAESVKSNDIALPLAETYIRQDADIQGLGLRATRSTRDNNFTPAEGGFYSVSAEQIFFKATSVGSPPAPSPLIPHRLTAPKFGVDLRQYISLQGKRAPGKLTEPKRIIAFRVLGGATSRDTPFSEQYFLGGADSLRGYDEDRYWGNYLLLVNAELRIPIGNSLTGVLFTDAGDAWGSIYQGSALKQHDSFKMQQSVGAGVRITTPIGPIRLDYGIGKEGSRADFSIGQSF